MSEINVNDICEIFDDAWELLKAEIKYRVGKEKGFTRYNMIKLVSYIRTMEYRFNQYYKQITPVRSVQAKKTCPVITLQEIFDLIEEFAEKDKVAKEIFTILLNDVKDKIGEYDPSSIFMAEIDFNNLLGRMINFFSNENNFKNNIPDLPIIEGEKEDRAAKYEYELIEQEKMEEEDLYNWDKGDEDEDDEDDDYDDEEDEERKRLHKEVCDRMELRERRLRIKSLAEILEISIYRRRLPVTNMIHPAAAELLLSLLREKVKYFNREETPPSLSIKEVIQLFIMKDYNCQILYFFCENMRLWLLEKMNEYHIGYLEGNEVAYVLQHIECGLIDLMNS